MTGTAPAPEDTIQYWIYPTTGAACDLPGLRDDALAAVSSHVVSYLWNCERFNLAVSACRTRLEGRVTYRDNVEDEWFVVALLRLISLELGAAVAVRAVDADGEVLLIEAADALPAWAQEPDTAEGRAWIFKGRLHLIPMARRPSELTPLPAALGTPCSPQAAARVVALYPEVTEASEPVQNAISARLLDYPSSWRSQEHVAHVWLPSRAARLLWRHPQLLAQAVHHVVARDARDARLLREMRRFPANGTDDGPRAVTFTKHLYALLASEKLLPYKKSGWSLPPASHPEFKGRALGFRLCAGLEILAARAEKAAGSAGEEKTDLTEDELNRLNGVGYFGRLLPGSRDYKALYEKAVAFFRDSAARQDEDEDTDERRSWDYLGEMKRAVERVDSYDPAPVAVAADLPPESDEDWLNVDQEGFDAMLGRHFGVSGNSEIPEVFKSFLQGTSDMKGVEEEGQKDDDDEDEDLDKPLEVNQQSLKEAFEKLARLTEQEFGADDEDEDDDSSLDGEAEAEYIRNLEEELKASNVFQENNLGVEENLMQNLLASMRSQVDETGPASTLFKSVLKQAAEKKKE